MSWAEDVDLCNEVCEDAFGEDVIYRPADAEADADPLVVTAIFDVEPGHADAGGAAPITSAEPRLTVRTSTLGREPRRGDRVTVAGTHYRVVEIWADSAGDGRRLRLHRDHSGSVGGGGDARRP